MDSLLLEHMNCFVKALQLDGSFAALLAATAPDIKVEAIKDRQVKAAGDRQVKVMEIYLLIQHTPFYFYLFQ